MTLHERPDDLCTDPQFAHLWYCQSARLSAAVRALGHELARAFRVYAILGWLAARLTRTPQR